MVLLCDLLDYAPDEMNTTKKMVQKQAVGPEINKVNFRKKC